MCAGACAGWVGARGLRVYRVKDPGVLFRLPKFGHSRRSLTARVHHKSSRGTSAFRSQARALLRALCNRLKSSAKMARLCHPLKSEGKLFCNSVIPRHLEEMIRAARAQTAGID